MPPPRIDNYEFFKVPANFPSQFIIELTSFCPPHILFFNSSKS